MDYFECKHGPEYWKKKNKKWKTSTQYKQRIPCLFPTQSPRKFVLAMKVEPVFVTMRFLGVKDEEDLTSPMPRLRRKYLQQLYNARSKVVVFQQPCGLYARMVFSKVIRPRDHISFRSLRREGHPFSLTIYVDGSDVTRVSQCCEYRRQAGEHVGGQHGHFIMVDVEGGYPCSRCMAARDYRLQRQEKVFRQLDRKLHDTVHSARKKIQALEENYLADVDSHKSLSRRSATSAVASAGSGSPAQVASVSASSAKRKPSAASAGGSLIASGEDGAEEQSDDASESGASGSYSGSASDSGGDSGSDSDSGDGDSGSDSGSDED